MEALKSDIETRMKTAGISDTTRRILALYGKVNDVLDEYMMIREAFSQEGGADEDNSKFVGLTGDIEDMIIRLLKYSIDANLDLNDLKNI